ncbi:hypothetical protein [Aliivibrio fischeri]|uniref:hypothetical protein n=1 Tax=Aliivibrio fischeri TaxID=668 RepID=UPI0007C5A013|nr:hypothetical protein [Aliivibrio fischeri]
MDISTPKEPISSSYPMMCNLSQRCFDKLFDLICHKHDGFNEQAKLLVQDVIQFTDLINQLKQGQSNNLVLSEDEVNYLWSCVNNPLSHSALIVEMYQRKYQNLQAKELHDLIRQDSGYTCFKVSWLKDDLDYQYVWAKKDINFLVCFLQLSLEDTVHYDKLDLVFSPELICSMLIKSFDVCIALPSDSAIPVSIHDAREHNINTPQYNTWINTLAGALPNKYTLLGSLGALTTEALA